MNRVLKLLLGAFGLLCLGLQTGCGILTYPGQPGLVTDNYSKIDMEDLEAEGLYVYETTYDNRPGQSGVAAIVTKLYPGAQTYTSCVRTNADGTNYRTKGAYNGAVVEMISLPASKQVMMPPNSTIMIMAQYPQSLNEIDDVNTAELNLFQPSSTASLMLTPHAMEAMATKLSLLKAGHLTAAGTLSYEVASLNFAGKVFTPSENLVLQTNFIQNGVQSNLSKNIRQELTSFIEQNFSKGFSGQVSAQVKGSTTPINFKLALHTLKTAEAAGIKIMQNVGETQMQEAVHNVEALTQTR
jgi:hypothetical protein